MLKFSKRALLLVSSLFITSAQAADVDLNSLLNEMIDRDSVARFPANDFRLKQHSSYDRNSIERGEPKHEPSGWFANRDHNKEPGDSNFIRVEENNGQKEWVLMDHQGPGALVRTWMPWRKQTSAETDMQIRIYLDGSNTPIFEGHALELLNGDGPFKYPFAHPSLRSAVSFFPIPYAKSMKITATEMPFFYIFTFRDYDDDVSVKTLSKEDFEAAAPLIEKAGKTLVDAPVVGAEKSLEFVGQLAPKAEKSIDLPAGVASLRELSVKLGDYSDPSVTRSVVLKIEFDGKQTVWTPIGPFFGSGIGLHPFKGWYRTVAEDGTMSSRWVMPYQKGGKVTLVNLGDQPVEAQLKVRTGKWHWDDRSMYFHAGWRGQYPVPTRPYSDWNYGTFTGRGVYVGDTLTVMNPVDGWWGEGDEKIFVDGEDFPSMFGTGTEDYYAYSWGGRSNDFYEHPFHAQVRANKYNKLNRKQDDSRGTLGYSTETRTRSLDTMPFSKSLQLDMEVWHWQDVEMGYGVGMQWYGDLATKSNRKPEPVEVLNVPPDMLLGEAVDDQAKNKKSTEN